MDRYLLRNKAFSLIELVIAMGAAAILLSAVVPVAVRSMEIKAAEKTVLEISYLQDAVRHFYKDQKTWPTNFQQLKDGGYISRQWSVSNPWGHSYQMSNDAFVWSIGTEVPSNLTGLLAMRLPQTTVTGDYVSSAIVSPNVDANISSGVIVAWSGAIIDIPTGWALCDGNNGTPDLRDKFIVGARQDDQGVSKTNILGSLAQAGGAISHNHTGQTGTHVLNITEIPAHDHDENPWVSINLSGPIGLYGSSPGGSANMFSPTPRTGMTGGGQGHVHTISVDYNVPPFYALAFIMKL